MKAYKKLLEIQEKRNSKLCIGLDSDINKIPSHFKKDIESIYKFNCEIISATREFAASYKINFAFYEQYGSHGFNVLKKTIEFLGGNEFIIADSKRGDIGNTSAAYAASCFEYFNADAITVAPYMGKDSLSPFLNYKDKLTFVLALTSNPGSEDFQRLVIDGKQLYQHVIEKCNNWSNPYSIGFVAGATHPNDIYEIRKIAQDNFLLIPGVGTQGGDIQKIMDANSNAPCIVNVSRDIIYSGSGLDFANLAAAKANYYRNSLNLT
jgi:orotidine-5'-phosphate decarboxylase